MGDVRVSIIFGRPLRSVQLGFETSVYLKDECLEERSENCNVSLRDSASCCGSAQTCCLQLALAVVRFGIFGLVRNSSDSHRTAYVQVSTEAAATARSVLCRWDTSAGASVWLLSKFLTHGSQLQNKCSARIK
jgi:hypothetical protein